MQKLLIKKTTISNLYQIRYFEQSLLKLFSKGLIGGTTHTCIGQETNAIGIINNLDRKDMVVSNHRCHGHFLAHTNNYEGLLYEILGNTKGVCGGIGGSQHLCVPDIFYSNGILGGNIPMAVGLAYSNKLQKNDKLVCLFIGDGVFGEGVVYESINIAIKKELSILFIIEDNEISQSTFTKEVISGSIEDKIKSFKGECHYFDKPDVFSLLKSSKKIIQNARYAKPQFVILKSNRLAPHSKGDDSRSEQQLKEINNSDTLLKSSSFLKTHEVNEISELAEKYVNNIFEKCLGKNNDYKISTVKQNTTSFEYKKINFDKKNLNKFGQIINNNIFQIMKNNNKVVVIGEDIKDPYGGAFKITKGLSTNFDSRVYSTPNSEASIVGLAGGLSLNGYYPIVEIMFGDFLSIAFDQILNNVSKFHLMYNKQVSTPMIIRAPMGGGRGYGPTHSQSIEKFFLGIEGLNVFAVNPFIDLNKLYSFAFNLKTPSLFLENKKDYNFDILKINNLEYESFKYQNIYDSSFNTIFSINSFDDSGTIICYGGMLSNALSAVRRLYFEKEISIRVLCIGQISPLNKESIINNSAKNGFVLSLEESTSDYGFGSEIISIFYQSNIYKNNSFAKIGSKSTIIPASRELEKNILLNEDDIYKKIEELSHYE